MLKKIILLLFILWIMFTFGKLSIMYVRVYHSHKEAQEQLNKQLAEQERINKMTVEEIIKEIPPKFGVKVAVAESVTKCESTHNPNAINYHDGGYGKHSVGLWQFQKLTFDSYAKKMGEELDYYSAYDQTKVASYMIAHGKANSWTCYRKLYSV